METGIKHFCIFILFCSITTLVEGSGHLNIHLQDYNNPSGEAGNGQCCDGRWIFCESGGGCDHYFRICVDMHLGSSKTDQCSYLLTTTGVISDKKHIVFGSDIGGTPNPIVVPFTAWMGGVRVNIQVYDKDDNDDDWVDTFNNVMWPIAGQTVEWTGGERTQLQLSMLVECDTHYYGDKCLVYCAPSDTYTCSHDGKKICKIGWEGSECDINIDDCVHEPCLNNGTCVDLLQAYYCLCPQHTLGENCQYDIDTLNATSCVHGEICIDITTGPGNCVCHQGWTGVTCDRPIPGYRNETEENI